MKANPLPSISRLNELFELAGGTLIRIVGTGGSAKGTIAGHINKYGYVMVRIDGVRHPAHRVIFAMANNRQPTDEIDHINLDKNDNRPENLREANRSQNASNMALRESNKSGVTGVHWNTAERRWVVCIKTSGKRIHCGGYDDFALATFVRQCAEEKYHGRFARSA